MRAFSDPLRLQIIESLRAEPLSAAQVAKRSGEKTTKLYYHFLELERNHLIEVARTQQRGNLVEKFYQPTAKFYRVDTGLFEKGPEALGAFYQNVSALLDQSAMLLRSAIDAGRVTEAEATASRRLLVGSRLSQADAESFDRDLSELLEKYGKRSSPDEEVGISLTLVFYTEKPDAA